MTQVRYPTIDLFLYDLHDSLGASSKELHESRRRFWQRIYNGTLTEAKLSELQATEKTFASYVELLGDRRREPFSPEFDGYYYPVKLGDTYALQVDCSGRKDDPTWESLPLTTKLQQTKDIVLSHTHDTPGDMGQNWLIWGQLTEAEQDPEAIAQECYEAANIISDANWRYDLKSQGCYKGAKLFELERRDYVPDGINQNHYVLVCLFPHDQTKRDIQKTLGQLYRNLIRIFYSRNKILWVYEQSRKLKLELKERSSTIKDIVGSLSNYVTAPVLDLKQLQVDLSRALKASHYYETSLSYLQEQVSTIQINTDNYNKRILELAKLDSDKDEQRAREKLDDADGSLAFLQRFGDFAHHNYLSQIQVDYEALSAGLKPLDNFIQAVEGITEIEKAKNERTFNRTVAAASVGISAASLFASTYTGQAAEIVQTLRPFPANTPTPALNTWLTFGSAFLFSVIVGVCGAALTWYLLSNRTKRS
ncbi:MAG: hypothetical protein ACFB4J_15010 [Elainellaceae cyanobacterium]